MYKMNDKEMCLLSGGKTKKCRGCNKNFRTWLTYNYHMLGKKTFVDCLLHVIKNTW